MTNFMAMDVAPSCAVLCKKHLHFLPCTLTHTPVKPNLLENYCRQKRVSRNLSWCNIRRNEFICILQSLHCLCASQKAKISRNWVGLAIAHDNHGNVFCLIVKYMYIHCAYFLCFLAKVANFLFVIIFYDVMHWSTLLFFIISIKQRTPLHMTFPEIPFGIYGCTLLINQTEWVEGSGGGMAVVVMC